MSVHTATHEERDAVREELRNALSRRGDVLFAYLHGSFLEGAFRDVDVAVVLQGHPDRDAALRGELEVEEALQDALGDAFGFPVDARVLNHAPLPFAYDIVHDGERVFSRDEDARSSFEERTLARYHDFDHHRRTYLRDALGLEV